MENIFELVDKKLKKLREAEAEVKSSTTNTSDEKTLGKTIIQLPALINRLKMIDQPIELDGLFAVILELTGLTDVNKQTVMLALKKALDELAPGEPTITTKKSNIKKK
jgi:hypothetical protein